jgi:F0F1-type ATP synthase membrane subunit b/b'
MALMAIDEALFRQSLRADLLEDLQAQRRQLRDELRSKLEQAAADIRAQAGQRIDRVFVPATDG